MVQVKHHTYLLACFGSVDAVPKMLILYSLR